MNYDQALKLMELMIEMNFDPVLIMDTVYYAELHNCIGQAFFKAVDLGVDREERELCKECRTE